MTMVYIGRRLLLLAAFLISLASVYGDHPVGSGRQARFEHLSFADGLVNASISAVVQDDDGFLWFGSQAGLHRYDGKDFDVFTSEPFDSESLNHHLIQTLHLANRDTLWVGTYGGLNRVNLNDYSISSYPRDSAHNGYLDNEVVTAVLQDDQERVWIGTLDGLSRLDSPDARELTRFLEDPDDPAALPHRSIRALFQDSSSDIWVGSYGGLSRVRERNNTVEFETFSCDPGLDCSAVMTLAEDQDGTLWAGTWGDGLFSFDPETESLVHHGIADAPVYTMLVDPEGGLYLGTWGGGLYHYVPETGDVQHYTSSQERPTSLAHDIVYSLHLDTSGILWVGTNGNGISKLNTLQRDYTVLDTAADKAFSLQPDRVSAIEILPEGDWLIGYQRGGIDRYRPDSGIVRRYRAPQGRQSGKDELEEGMLGDQNINDILIRNDGSVLVATNGGVYEYRPQQHSFHRKSFNPDVRHDVNEDIIYSLAEQSDGTLWIGTFTRGIVRRNPDGSMRRYEHASDDSGSLSNDLVYSIYVDSRDVVWAATNGGLNRYRRADDAWFRYLHDPDDPTSISSNSVNSVYEDSYGRIWVGTRAGGLNLYNPLEGNFRHWTLADGLNSNSISAITESLTGDVFVATANGMNVFDPVQEEFRSINRAEGLLTRQFSEAVYRRQDGSVLFGARGTIVALQSSQPAGATAVPRTLITDLQVENAPYTQGNPNRVDTLELEYSQDQLLFGFAAADYTLPDHNQYRIRMLGFDDQWQSIGTRSFAEYTNLRPGNYTFQVQAANSLGSWDPDPRSIEVRIHPPLWQTAAFRIVIVLLLLGIVVGLHRSRLSRLRRLNHRLDEQVKERTRELMQINHELSDANAVKDRFFSIVAHDLRGPVSGLTSYVDGMMDSVERLQKEDVIESFSAIHDTASGIQRLLENLFEWGELQRSQAPVVLERVRVADVLRKSVDGFRGMLESKQIQTEVKCSDELEVSSNPQVFASIIHNLMHNAIKFSQAHSLIQLHADHHTISGMARIEVIDHGIGMTPQQLRTVWRLDTQHRTVGTAGEKGSGLGLVLCREMVESVGGSLNLYSERHAGTQAVVILPLSRPNGFF